MNEAAAGDLNGDGDTLDAVVHVADGRSEVSLNLGLAASTVCRTTMVPPFVECQPVEPVVARTVAAFLVDEAAQGGLDLNGDGDAQDAVLYVYDGQSRQLITTALAVAHGVGRDVSSFTFPIAPVVTEKLVVFLVSEAESGGVDLNGDTDTVDAVLHLVDLKTAAMVNLAKAAATIPGPFGSGNPVPPSVNGQKVTLTVGESEQGGEDLNGDGEADNQVTYVVQRLLSGSDPIGLLTGFACNSRRPCYAFAFQSSDCAVCPRRTHSPNGKRETRRIWLSNLSAHGLQLLRRPIRLV